MSIARLTEIQERFVDTQNCKGKLFNYNYRNTLGASGTINFAILTPSTRVNFLPVQIQINTECQVDYYQGSTITADTGTSILANMGCLNQFSPRALKMVDARINPTITNNGVLVYPDYIYANKITASQNLDNPMWVLAANSWYVCRITNQDNQAGILKINMYWIEC